MKIALIASNRKNDLQNFVPEEGAEILTNIPDLAFPSTYIADLDELIKNADYVTVLVCKGSRIPDFYSKCKKYKKSFEIRFL